MFKKLDCDEGPKDFDGPKDLPKDIFEMLNFPLEDVEQDIDKDDWNDIPLPDLPLDYCVGFTNGLVGVYQNDCSKPNKILPTSYEKACRLKQIPSAAAESTIKTSSAGGKLLSHDSSDVKNVRLFKTSSPVSILESTSSCFTENQMPVDKKFIVPKKRARSKRTRSSNVNKLRSLSFLSSTSSSFESLCLESDSGTVDDGKMFKQSVKKPVRKGKIAFNIPGTETKNFNSQEQNTTKKCTHCEVTNTPQWREGPLGPKTLCNACGVRYRSGRLFPEYRPAASPTFIPSVHSNSHKKVIEMRNKGNQGTKNSSRASVELYCCSQPGNSVRHVFV
ncbi:GATA transcription factor 11-like [Humulus lupulus]|uniref:GATA transcription factor 11-like n=1 Tax=Humulus lupulus TaxID=3486 RepID=UPI002B407CC3|nr:GATA transcription factor 11-like [Humulus lupulus]